MDNNATTAIDTVTQTIGADTLTISAMGQLNVGDVFNGGDGIDTIIVPYTVDPLLLSSAFSVTALDLRLVSLLNYEAMTFSSISGESRVEFLASQFGSTAGQLPLNFIFNATSALQRIKISGVTNFDASGFVFNGWTRGGDTIEFEGTAADNTFVGSSVTNWFRGLGGNDTYHLKYLTDAVYEELNEGIDTVHAGFTYTLGANSENLVLTGTGGFNGTGNGLNNTITGNSGANVLNGGAGADTMIGGLGNDTYYIDDAGDVIVEGAAAGTADTVVSIFDYALVDLNLENLTLTGAANLTGSGNLLANKLIGNAGNNTLSGFAGNDIIDGGLGNDTMTGGLGNDSYTVNSTQDIVVELAELGTDLVSSSATYTLSANVENLTLTGAIAINGTGNISNNVIVGNAASNTLIGLEGNDTLTGGAGVDTMIGGVGNDIYSVDVAGDIVTEALGGGTDLVNSSASYTLSAHVENLTLAGAAALTASGNELNNLITGNAGANTLYGFAGNDTLNGGTGNDIMHGGTGNDIYHLNVVTDTVVENLNEGIDTVNVAFSHTLSDINLENLTLTATAALVGTGNAVDNVIIGNSVANTLYGLGGNDTLDGGSGNDTMVGGVGNDIYIVGAALDIVTELANEGTDTVKSTIAWTLGDNLEHLTLTGTSGVAGTGNARDNVINGNTGANVLNGLGGNDILSGGTGADKMTGGIGSDTYYVENIGDVVTELAADLGYDVMRSSISSTIAANVEELELIGTGNINATGNSQINLLRGNAGNNILDGAAGGGVGDPTDYLHGGLGNDTYIIDSFIDNIYEIAGAGTDTVMVGSGHTLSSTQEVENLTLSGTAAINGKGNALNNVLVGNSAANQLEGLDGNDTYVGGGGADYLIGGNGADTFVYNNLSDSVGLSKDTITNFDALDMIDLSVIDADAVLAGNQAFVFDTDGIFAAGEVRVTNVNGTYQKIEAHTNSDGVADLSIEIITPLVPTITASDFIL